MGGIVRYFQLGIVTYQSKGKELLGRLCTRVCRYGSNFAKCGEECTTSMILL